MKVSAPAPEITLAWSDAVAMATDAVYLRTTVLSFLRVAAKRIKRAVSQEVLQIWS